MDLRTLFGRPTYSFPAAKIADFADLWTTKRVERGVDFVEQGNVEGHEYILLNGKVASQINDPDGHAICVGLNIAPSIITPNLARTRKGVSLVSLAATTECLVAQMNSAKLSDLMLSTEAIRDWANNALREELGRKSDREWCLAALGGADRLDWFRKKYPGYEDAFGHTLIASFLGMTPVTLSRLRHPKKSAAQPE